MNVQDTDLGDLRIDLGNINQKGGYGGAGESSQVSFILLTLFSLNKNIQFPVLIVYRNIKSIMPMPLMMINQENKHQDQVEYSHVFQLSNNDYYSLMINYTDFISHILM